MATFTKFQPFVESLAEKKIDLSGAQLTVALTTNANAPTPGMALLSEVTQINYANLSSRVVTVFSHAQVTGTFKLCLTDLVLTASGTVATFRWVILYDDAAINDNLIAYWDKGVDVSMVIDDTFTIDFDPTNGVLQLA